MKKQQELPNMPGDRWEGTLIGELTDKYAEKKEAVAAAKLEMMSLKGRILEQMKGANETLVVRSIGGENYEFELIHGDDDLRCAKITKRVAKKINEDAEEDDDAI